MTWLCESPYGSQRLNSWRCTSCPAGSGEERHGEQGDVLRAAAQAHVQATGHEAEVRHGTREWLLPVAIESPEGQS